MSINRYKEIEYEEVDYGNPREILSELKDLEKEIIVDIEDLGKMISA